MRQRKLSLIAVAVLLRSATFAQVPAAPSSSAPERLTADAPRTTAFGNAFIAPKDWSLRQQGAATILEAPEGDTWNALVDVQGTNNDEALAAAWKAYKPDAKWPVKVTHDLPDREGRSRRRVYEYLTSPNERRAVTARHALLGRKLDRRHSRPL